MVENVQMDLLEEAILKAIACDQAANVMESASSTIVPYAGEPEAPVLLQRTVPSAFQPTRPAVGNFKRFSRIWPSVLAVQSRHLAELFALKAILHLCTGWVCACDEALLPWKPLQGTRMLSSSVTGS